jgi:hypothetical protein
MEKHAKLAHHPSIKALQMEQPGTHSQVNILHRHGTLITADHERASTIYWYVQVNRPFAALSCPKFKQAHEF